MPEEFEHEPWEQLMAIVSHENAEELDAFLDTLSSGEIARAVSRLDSEEQARLVTLLRPEDAADLIQELSDLQGIDLLEDLPPDQAAAIVDEMESDHRVDILGELDTDEAEAILREMDPEEAQDARQLLVHPTDTAGGIMVTEFLSYRDDLTVGDVLEDLQANAEEYSDYGVQYAYVVNRRDRLTGVVPLRNLVLTPRAQLLSKAMIPNPHSVQVDATLDELEQVFDRYPFVGVPVVGPRGRLVGVVRRADAEQAYGERSEKTFMRFSGIIAGDELRNMPLHSRSVRRVSWLILNMFLNGVAVTVILAFEGVLQRVIALTMFLPLICNISGCSGNQAVAVSIRELALGILEPRDFFRVMLKEVQVGLVNGIVLGLLLGVATYAFGPVLEANTHSQRFYLGLVVGTALALNSVVSVSLGGSIPLVLRKLKVDPALAAAPIVTTIIDMCGFFFVLGIARLLIDKLV